MNTPSIVVMSVAGRVVLVLFQQNVLSHSKKQTLFYYPLTALHRLFRLAFGPHTLMTALALPHMSNTLVEARDLMSTTVHHGMCRKLQEKSR